MHLGATLTMPTYSHRLQPAYLTHFTGLQSDWIDRAHDQRASVEQFIADVYARQYQAKVSHFCDELIGCRDADGRWVAAVGLTPLAYRPAYLEQYLDRPVEQMIGMHEKGVPTHTRVARWCVVELGNLACAEPGMTRAVIILMTRYLYRQQYRWAVFTATRTLLNAFRRVRLKPVEIATASPEKIDGATQLWGSYYEHQPRVMFCGVQAAYERIK